MWQKENDIDNRTETKLGTICIKLHPGRPRTKKTSVLLSSNQFVFNLIFINDEMVYMKWILYELRMWNQVKLWSSQLWAQFLQLRREAWKIQDFNGVWTRDLAIPVRHSNQLSYEPLTSGAGHLWVLIVPWGMNQWWNGIYEMNLIWTGNMKSSEAMIFAVGNAIFATA